VLVGNKAEDNKRRSVSFE